MFATRVGVYLRFGAAGLVSSTALAISPPSTADWIRQFGTSAEERGFAVHAAADGSVYIGGQTEGPLVSPNNFSAVDREGNIAVVTHTINAVIWGDTGIVVDGIPIPDSAGFQQVVLAEIKPGDRVPHQIIDTIAFEGDTPVLATASIGSSLIPESIRVILSVLGKHQDLATVMAAPPLLQDVDLNGVVKHMSQKSVSIPIDTYTADFISKLKTLGLNLNEIPATTAGALRGSLAAVAIDPKTGKRAAVNQPNVMVFNGAE